MPNRSPFKLHTPFAPAGSQPEAIAQLTANRPCRSTLLGITGSGKTFTMAHVIANQDKPVLVLSPNKTLAAQLYEEFSLFFPENKVCYFVSYYDYYQPESYLPAQDLYIPKETKVNSEIERLRLESTASIINRPDTIVVTSVSSIYSLGNPTDYRNLSFPLKIGQQISRQELLQQLVFIQYKRNDMERGPGLFQVRGNTIEIGLPYYRDILRIELFGTAIEGMQWVNKNTNNVVMELDNTLIFPAKHFITPIDRQEAAMRAIRNDFDIWLPELPKESYRDRLTQRVMHDLEMLKETGYCSGIENYSVYFDGRQPGETPYCLFDFFPKDFLCIIDESHIAIPQLHGMYHGDRARKKVLIEFGFRLPSAYDNRPLQFKEVERFFDNVLFVSATPGDYELTHTDQIVEQIIRPTGLLDPVLEIIPRTGQMEHLIDAIKETRDRGFRTLIMVLTKKLAEQLALYLEEQQLKACYLHSELKTPQRTELIQKLRMGIFDCLVGVNLLREGLDIPEVALVAIMDADVESFLRDKRSLVQIAGRAARNAQSRVFLYADKITKSMHAAIQETSRRHTIQERYNKEHGIVPQTVKREVTKSIAPLQEAIALASKGKKSKKMTSDETELKVTDIHTQLIELETRMKLAAESLDFERAIALREEWYKLKKSQ
ncbi:MAG TPA: excinuclease ABC subunit UvrB [Candidatus Babeliales bacterium]|jgi:excinuclease ABC subunit B|nr:excinuclease ABC subunit UvrB [Candidatus Babeliales bacterium]